MREIIWLIIVALFGYVVFELYRVLRLGKQPPGRADATEEKDERASGAGTTGEDGGDDGIFVFDARPQSVFVPNSADTSPWSDAQAGESFQWALEIQQLRREVVQLRGELAIQRERLASVESTVAPLKEQLEAAVASQGISPEYNEALVFARRGLDVEVISERCGISVAEAELVRSLAKGRGG